MKAVNELETSRMDLWRGCGTWCGFGMPGEQKQCSHWREFGWGGTGDTGHEGRKGSVPSPGWNWGGRIAVQMLEVGQRKGKVHRWLPFCQEMPDLAARLGCEHSCADFPVPRAPWGSF